MRRGAALFILLAAAVGGLIWSLRTVFPRGVPEIEAFRARRGSLEVTLPLTGTVETRTVQLVFEIPGRLSAVTVREGDPVQAGTLVAAVDGTEALTAVAQAESALLAARREADRAAAAVLASRRQAEQAQFAYEAAEAALAQARGGPLPSELEQAQAAVDAARAALEEARRALARTEELLREGAVSQAQLDAARAQAEAAEARYRQALAQRDALRAGARPGVVEAAEAQVRQAGAARAAAMANIRQAEAAAAATRALARQAAEALRAARARAARTELRVPFAGTVTRVYLYPGSPVGPGIPVASLAAPGGWVTAEVDEADIGRVAVGQTARVTADAYPGRSFGGRITRVGQQVEVRLGSRVVRARIDLEDATALRVGTGVDVQVVLRIVSDALLVPAEAVIVTADGGPHLFVVEGGVLRRRDVRAGASNDRFTVILEGVREREQVVVAESGRLRDGLRVRVVAVR